nr:MAG: hypothetical protein [Bacteriophage sp.]
MTQKEFEERTGLKLSADGYTEVEECYMNTELDKDAFCKLWMENPTVLKEIERKTVLVRELYEERKWVVEWRKAKLVCQYPKGCVRYTLHFYDKRLGNNIQLNKDLNRLISAKAQVTKAQRNIDKYVAYNKAHNLFFDESTDTDLLKAREKLEAKIINVKEAEERMRLKIKQIQEGRNDKN